MAGNRKYLAHTKQLPPPGLHRALGKVLLYVPRRGVFLMNEVTQQRVPTFVLTNKIVNLLFTITMINIKLIVLLGS